MHLYDEAFVKEFAKEKQEVKVLSNYGSAYSIPLIRNFYHSGKLGNVLSLIYSCIKLFSFYLKHRTDVFVYQSFGLRYIDICFLSTICGSKNLFTIVHDAFEITNNNEKPCGKKFKIQKWVYKHWIRKVICHSKETVDTLKEYCNYSGQIILYPHFRYHFDKSFDLSNVGEDVKSSIIEGKQNLLFFGQLRLTKGVDVLIDSFQYLREEKGINIIVAGVDKGKLMENVKIPSNVVKILRYIKDDELNFLFTKCDVVLLPYKEIYQSGVLETVIHFEKFAIMSDVRAFNDFVTEYPSFGVIYSPNTGEYLAETIVSLKNHNYKYLKEDKIKYEKAHDAKILINKIVK